MTTIETTEITAASQRPRNSSDTREVTLLELLDRLLDKGVVLKGDITLSVAGVDLIVLDLALLLASAERISQLFIPGAPDETGARREPGVARIL